jgi:5-methyltetrahydrofolate--homocysteine methyltransferase
VETRLIGLEREVVVAPDRPTVLIGERINPIGRRRLARALKEGDLSLLEAEAKQQAREGADVIDIHVGGAEVDEAELLPAAVQLPASVTGLPICIDTSSADALEAALRVCPSKPLVNSVSGEARALEKTLPLAKEHGAAIIGLTMDEGGIPDAPDERLAITERILSQAVKRGIAEEDVIIDPLALSVGADQEAAVVTLDSIRLIADSLGVNMTLGASNVSFGLPERHGVNDVFLSLAIAAGVTCPLADPKRARRVILVTDLLLGRDEFATRYISYCRQHG